MLLLRRKASTILKTDVIQVLQWHQRCGDVILVFVGNELTFSFIGQESLIVLIALARFDFAVFIFGHVNKFAFQANRASIILKVVSCSVLFNCILLIYNNFSLKLLWFKTFNKLWTSKRLKNLKKRMS